MHICTAIKDTAQPLQTERNKYVFKRDLNDDSDGAHLTSFGIEFQTKEEAKEFFFYLHHAQWHQYVRFSQLYVHIVVVVSFLF